MQDLVTTMVKEQPDYLSYLLRLWRVRGEEKAVWRASLKSVHTGELKGFASLEVLFAFLREQTGVSSDLSEDGSGTGEQRGGVAGHRNQRGSAPDEERHKQPRWEFHQRHSIARRHGSGAE